MTGSDICCGACGEPWGCVRRYREGEAGVDVTSSPGHVSLGHGFVECDSCKAKPGSPTLCSGCLHNRSRAAEVQKEANRAEEWRVAAETSVLRNDELMMRSKKAEVLKRRAAETAKAVVDYELVEMRRYVGTLEDHITDLGLKISELELRIRGGCISASVAKEVVAKLESHYRRAELNSRPLLREIIGQMKTEIGRGVAKELADKTK